MKIIVKMNGQLMADNILLATSMIDRLVGLMFRSSPPKGSHGILLAPCNSIHTCFMRYALDIVFLDSNYQVVKVIRDMKPWRMSWIYFAASKTLELPAGKLPRDVKAGDFLEIAYV